MKKVPVPAELAEALKNSPLKFLWEKLECKECTLIGELRVTVYDATIGPERLSTLPRGTAGWLFEEVLKIHNQEGILTKNVTYYTWCTLVAGQLAVGVKVKIEEVQALALRKPR